MEAVPRLPMLSCELKISPSNTDFGVLKKYIRDNYHENPESYNKEIKELEALRQAACKVPRDFTGCSTLKQYYSQLHCLQSRFPMTDDGPACALFVWSDIYSNVVFNITDIKYEQACILYNIGALHSELGALDTRNNAEGMKIACTHFQCAAWAFQHLRDTYPQPKGSDMSHDLLTFFINVMLAQAQECILEKSMLDSRKSSITAKVAAQVVEYYRCALGVLLSGSPSKDAGCILAIVESRLFKEWKKFLEFKMAYYGSISHLYMGNQAEEQQKTGERVAWYQSALDKLNEAIKIAKGLDRDDVNEALTFTMDVIGGKFNAAKKENDFVYHDKVPPVESLPDVKGASLVKGIPFSPADPDVCGPDIFARLVPMEAHEASSMYSEEKAKLLRQISAKVEDKNQELMTYLSSLQLDRNMLNPKTEKIPQDLLEKCAAMSVRPTAISEMKEIMKSLADVAVEVGTALKEAKERFAQEEQKERQHQEAFGKRAPSMVVVDLRKEYTKYEEMHNKAIESDVTLQKAVLMHVHHLGLLAGPLDELQKALPSLTTTETPADESVVKELEHLLDKVDEMRKQRQMLESQLRETLQNDDITKLLVTLDKKEDLQKVFAEQLKKHDQQVTLLEQNLTAQDNILRALTQANAKYADTRKATTEILRRRDSMVSSLINSFDSYEDVMAQTQKGLEFYKKLQVNVAKLLARTRSITDVQDEERERISTNHAQKARRAAGLGSPVAASLGSPVAPSSATPKLKDYLPYMASRSGGVPIYPQSSAAVPSPVTPTPSVPGRGIPQASAPDPAAPTSYPAWMETPHVPSQVPQVPSRDLTPVTAAVPDIGASGSVGQHPHTPASFQNQTTSSGPQVPSEPPEISAMGVRPAPVGSEQTSTVSQCTPPFQASYTVNSISKPISSHSSYLQSQPISSSGNQQWHNQYAFPQYQNYFASSQSPAFIENVAPNGMTGHISVQYDSSRVSASLAPHSGGQKIIPAQSPLAECYSQPTSQSASSMTTPHSMPSFIQSSTNFQTNVSGTNYSQLHYPQSTDYAQSGTVAQQQPVVCQPSLPYCHSQSSYSQVSSAYSYAYPTHIGNSLPSGTPSQQVTKAPLFNGNVASSAGQYLNQPSSYQFYGSQYEHYLPCSQQSVPQVTSTVTSTTFSASQSQHSYTQAVYTHPAVSQPATVYSYSSHSQSGQVNGAYSQQPSLATYGSTGTYANIQQYSGYVMDSQYYQIPNSSAIQPVPSTYNQQTTYPSQWHEAQLPPAPANNYVAPTGPLKSTIPDQPQPSHSNVPHGSPSLPPTPPATPASSTPSTPQQKSQPCPTSSSPVHSQNVPGTNKDLLSSAPEGKTQSESQSAVLQPKVVTTPELQLQIEEKQEELRQVKDPLSDPSTLDKFTLEVEKFEKFVEGLTKKSLNGPTPLDQKWKELMDTQDRESRKLSISVARCYPMKNRYPEIMPYDNNRVALSTLRNDYINASFIKDLTPNCPKFIVTQAPLPATYADFWTMVWEQQVETIICLLNTSELKSHTYWPMERGQQMAHGPVTISLQSLKDKQFFVEHMISVTHNETRISRVVIHLQFTTWSPSGAPTPLAQLLQFVAEVHNYYKQQRSVLRPVIIHCSGGAGRSGVFFLIYCSMVEMAAGKGPLDATQIAARMSQQRKFLLLEKDQLKFSYDAILYHAQDLLIKRPSDLDLMNGKRGHAFQKLNQGGILTNKASFEDKIPSAGSHYTHSRHPSEDFILGSGGLAKLQSGMAKLGMSDVEKTEDSKEEGQISLIVDPENVTTAIISTSTINVDTVTTTTTTRTSHSKTQDVSSENFTKYSEQETSHISAVGKLEGGNGVVSIEQEFNHDENITNSNEKINQSICKTDEIDTAPSITCLLDPASFTLDPMSSPGKKRITKESFKNISGTLNQLPTDPKDPLSQLDPLWTLKKEKS